MSGRLRYALPLGLMLAGVVLTGAGAAKVLHVRIADMKFEPETVTAAVGDVIEWSNTDFVDHTATSVAGGFDVTIPAGQSASVALGKAGTFPYICRYHPDMTGSVSAR